MKGFALVLCVAFFVALTHGLTEDQREKVKAVHAECQADPVTHVDEEQLKKAYTGEDIKGLGVHFLCMSKKLNFQKANGDVDKALLKTKLSQVITDETKLTEAVEKCGTKKATPEDTAEHLLKCYHDNVGHVLHVHHH